jgi:hypothetical protein
VSDTRACRILLVVSLCVVVRGAVSLHRYNFDVVTSDVRGGGTDAAVSLELCGAAGSCAGPWVLDRPGAFGRGQVCALYTVFLGTRRRWLHAAVGATRAASFKPAKQASSRPSKGAVLC